jgi:hypothetical protein
MGSTVALSINKLHLYSLKAHLLLANIVEGMNKSSQEDIGKGISKPYQLISELNKNKSPN